MENPNERISSFGAVAMKAEKEHEPIPDRVKPVQRFATDESAEPQAETSAKDSALVERVACRAGDDSCATAHASTLNRATLSRPSRAEGSLLQLQRQYGNRYVGRVLTLARQATGDGNADAGVSTEVETAIQKERGSGHGLDTGVRGQMEDALGADFSGVRVHVDAQSDSLNRSLSARAFTTGQDIFFSQGAYQPGSSTGRELIAHELTHVVQQDGDKVRRAMTVSQPGDPHEVEAEETARAVMRSETSGASREDNAGQGTISANLSGLQRQPEAPKEEDEEKRKQSAPIMKVDRAPGPGDAPAKTDPPATAAGPPPATAANAHKTVAMTLTAIYEDVPGEAQDKVKRAKGKEALWLDPLTMLSNYPVEKRNTISEGVVAGGGQKTVETYNAPISDSVPASGRGSISASLKYAGDQNISFDVTVAGIKRDSIASAEAMARKIIEREIRTYGDVDEIAATAEKELNAVDKYQGAKVAISVRDNKVMDAGSTTFYYKVRSDAGIEMDMQAAPVGEKQTRYSGSKTSGTTTEDESGSKARSLQEKEAISKKDTDAYKKKETSTESQDVEYYENVVKTLDDYVSKATTVRNELASDLAEDIVKHHESTWGDKELTHRTAGNHTDYTKDSKHTVESGERDKENLAAKLKKGVKIAKDVTSIPYVDKVPVLGWLTRKVKGWELDLAEDVLGLFEETGKVKFTDTKLDENVKSDQTIKDDTDRTRNVELKEDDKNEVKSKLTESFKSATNEEWQNHLKEITETSKTYRSKIKKDADATVDQTRSEDYKRDNKQDETQSDERRRTLANQSTTATFEVASTWKFTKPVVKASVTSGDAEVSYAPFPPEADEVANATKKDKPATP